MNHPFLALLAQPPILLKCIPNIPNGTRLVVIPFANGHESLEPALARRLQPDKDTRKVDIPHRKCLTPQERTFALALGLGLGPLSLQVRIVRPHRRLDGLPVVLDILGSPFDRRKILGMRGRTRLDKVFRASVVEDQWDPGHQQAVPMASGLLEDDLAQQVLGFRPECLGVRFRFRKGMVRCGRVERVEVMRNGDRVGEDGVAGDVTLEGFRMIDGRKGVREAGSTGGDTVRFEQGRNVWVRDVLLGVGNVHGVEEETGLEGVGRP